MNGGRNMAKSRKNKSNGGRSMKFSVSTFTEGIVAVIIGVILLVAVAVPIIGANTVPETFAMADVLNTIISTIPVFVGIALILAVMYMFISRRS